MGSRTARYVLTTCWLTAMLAWIGCARYVSVSPQPDIQGDARLLILPFTDLTALHGEYATVRSPITGKVFETGPVAADARSELGDLLLTTVRSQTDFKLVPAAESGRVLPALMEMRESGLEEKHVATAAGRAVNADMVMAGFIYRYRERLGGEFSIESPASVAFDLHLIRVSDGRLLWSGGYDETQKPLSDNLMELGTFFRRKARWVTASEMANPAVTEMITRLVSP